MTRLSDRPTSDEVRAALGRIFASRTFRASPQLTAFLRFVVEAELAGARDRIKGYTIAVEALGRSEDFDPQADPIVRVEAARLRRALERYYAEAGPSETIVVDLPRGSYVPKFRRVGTQSDEIAPPLQSARSFLSTLLRGQSWSLSSRVGVPAVLILVLVAIAAYGLLDVLVLDRTALNSPTTAGPARPVAPSRHIWPVVYIEPIRRIGGTDTSANSVASLQERMYDAFVRFDAVQVVTAGDTEGQTAAQAADYRLASRLDYRENTTASLIVRLSDTRDNVVFWSRSFDLPAPPNGRTATEGIIKTVAAVLNDPYGAIYARELSKSAGSPENSSYACIQRAHEYLWTRNPTLRAEARACLERAVAADPTFVRARALLGAFYVTAYRFQEGQGDMLDRALTSARTAVRLNASSARANAVLADVLAARGLFDDAKDTAERAVALNPLDPLVVFYNAAVLVLSGEIDKADAALRDVFASLPDPPQRAYFLAFLAEYLRGNLRAAAAHSARLTKAAYAPALLAHALVAWKTGDKEEARRAVEALMESHPGWRTDPAGEIRRFLPLPEVADRVAADFAAATRFAQL